MIIVLVGFGVGFVVVDWSWDHRVAAAGEAETGTVARAMAAALGSVLDEGPEACETTLQTLVDALPRVRALEWRGPDGQMRYRWPPALVAAARAGADGGSGGRGPRAVQVTVPVASASGEAAGALTVTREIAVATGSDAAFLLWHWAVTAGVTLLVFAAYYYGLRRHLRPVAAIERSLKTYADGLEKELTTLTLSASLGAAARGWNLLVEELTVARRQLQSVREGAGTQQVLARFEGAAFRRTVDRLPYGVLWVNGSDCVSYCNGAGAALLGQARELVSGRGLSELMDNPAVLQAVGAVRGRAGAGQTIDHTRKTGDQECTLRIRVLPLSEQAGGETLVTIEDISQLRENERARDNFLYHVTHELRTPLTNIHAYVETLTQPGFDDEQTRKECYNVLISETERLARLDLGDVDLVRLVRQMVQDNLGAADEKRIDLTLSLPPKVPKLKGDKQRLCVLLNNLIGNALKYTPEGGKVHVNVEVEPRRVLIAVNDTGIGIAPPDQEHVFEKFYRSAADAVQQITGTGLGLALAREVARLHGGDIRLTSTLGQGSTFTIELPLPAESYAEVAGR